MDADDAVGKLLDASKSGELKAVMMNVMDATTAIGERKYSARVCQALARTIVCRTYAKDVLQLCYLVNAVNACGGGIDRYEHFFFGEGRASTNNCAYFFDQAIAARGWLHRGFERTDAGVSVRCDDSVFGIAFSRMPLLAALYELLIETVGYLDVDTAFTAMLAEPGKRSAVEDAANTISRGMYGYLTAHLPTVQNKLKFERLLGFLRARSDDQSVEIGDDTILDFWLACATEADGNFRLYRSAFDAFVALIRALDTAETHHSVKHATTIGGDRDAGELDPDMLLAGIDPAGEWTSPLEALDEEPTRRIKFLTNTEFGQLELLMACGPLARDLPLSILRCEVFGLAQSRIRQAVRRKLGGDEMRLLTACADCETYAAREQRFRDLDAHIERVIKAAFFVVMRRPAGDSGDNVVAFDAASPERLFESAMDDPIDIDGAALDTAIDDARRAFRRFSRAGFDEESIDDPDIIEGFRRASGTLLATRDELGRYLDVVGSIDFGPRFDRDRGTFSGQFDRLYGGPS